MSFTVRVDNAAIASLFNDESDLGRFTGRVYHDAYDFAKITAPKRTGELAASINGYTNRYYTYGRRIQLSADAPYARYVIEGTTSPILPLHSTYGLHVHPAWNGHRAGWHPYVMGQEANNFLGSSLSHAFMANGIVIPPALF